MIRSRQNKGVSSTQTSNTQLWLCVMIAKHDFTGKILIINMSNLCVMTTSEGFPFQSITNL